MNNTCVACGQSELEPGFMEDRGEGSSGYGRWVQGELEQGVFGGAKLMGRPRSDIRAYRCTSCGFLHLYAGSPT